MNQILVCGVKPEGLAQLLARPGRRRMGCYIANESAVGLIRDPLLTPQPRGENAQAE